jgi:hypothetical protein
LFDYRTNYGWDYYGESRAIIEKWGDYRPMADIEREADIIDV